jgi:hypothetical protein
VHGFRTGTYVTLATGVLLLLVALFGLVVERRRKANARTTSNRGASIECAA